MSETNQELAEDIARGALNILWWDTESAARRVAEYAADRIEQLEAELAEARMQALSELGQAQEAYEAQKKAEAERDAAYNRGLEEALAAIASLPTPRNEEIMEGHEEAYRAIEAIRAKMEGKDG